MEEKKKKNIFLKVLLFLFIIYFSLYLMDNLGYYNVHSKNTILTEEMIVEFENDVKNGKEIDIKEYTKDNGDYINSYSNFGYIISNAIDKFFNEGLDEFGDFLEKLFK